MGRQQRPIDPSRGPVAAFAAELRKLRDEAGAPTYAAMAKKAHISKTVLSEAAGGARPPTWPAVRSYLQAVDLTGEDDVARWHSRWEEMREEVARLSGSPAAKPLAPDHRDDGPDPSAAGVTPDAGTNRRSHARRMRLAVGIAGAACMAAVLAVAFAPAPPPSATSTADQQPPPMRVVVVSNMIAVGPDSLIEDTTPSYLSTVPKTRCASRGCKIPGTEMWSGALVHATCYTHGPKVVNYDLNAPGVTNPHRAASTLWYRGTMASGSSAGYLSEVYVAAAYRGGLGLATCPETPTNSPG